MSPTTFPFESPVIYLASQSERRFCLLAQAKIPFLPLSLKSEGRGAVREVPHAGERPEDYVNRMARAKAVVGLRQSRLLGLSPLPVLGADTEVVLADNIFGKPKDADDARAMLSALSGVTHQVISSVALATMNPNQAEKRVGVKSATVITQVTMKPLSDAEITDYLVSSEWQGKAGAYAIQGCAGSFVKHLSGSFTGVVGLPLFETVTLITPYLRR
ncbi:MAG: Maf family nucleotide pyrophosphatase [Burkholderiales bacterium]|nr:Maf family nucleotide pyrophosphatase [Burkholderiales bacterium]